MITTLEAVFVLLYSRKTFGRFPFNTALKNLSIWWYGLFTGRMSEINEIIVSHKNKPTLFKSTAFTKNIRFSKENKYISHIIHTSIYATITGYSTYWGHPVTQIVWDTHTTRTTNGFQCSTRLEWWINNNNTFPLCSGIQRPSAVGQSCPIKMLI